MCLRCQSAWSLVSEVSPQTSSASRGADDGTRLTSSDWGLAKSESSRHRPPTNIGSSDWTSQEYSSNCWSSSSSLWGVSLGLLKGASVGQREGLSVRRAGNWKLRMSVWWIKSSSPQQAHSWLMPPALTDLSLPRWGSAPIWCKIGDFGFFLLDRNGL